MTTLAALTGPLPKLGVVVLGLLAGLALTAVAPRLRTAATLGALALSPVLLLAAVWHSPQLAVVHRHAWVAVLAALLGLAAVAGLAWLISGRLQAVAFLAVAALPFRVPISVSGTTFNLLVPLYLVVLAGSLGMLLAGRRGGLSRDAAAPVRWGLAPPRDSPVEWLLAIYILLYGLQAIYSDDFAKALQQMVFFYVPFALLFLLLRDLTWSRAQVRRCLQVACGLALVFSLIGFVEYATKTLLLNPKLIAANEVHTYFTVNSVFFDPDIFGRFLVLVMICLTAVLLYERRTREQVLVVAVLAILWGCLVLTLSRSSLGALLVGLGIIAALRWRASLTLGAAAAVVVVGLAAIAISPKTFGLNQGLNGASSGRAGLVSGGIRLFGERPVWGWGSASFVNQYRRHHPGTAPALAASHTIAVTIAAEQGLIGLLVYVALVLAAATRLLAAARGDPARIAVGAAFVALVFHTLLYADFLEDPTTWALLGLGLALSPGLARAGARSHSGVVYAPLMPPSTRNVDAVT